jgi:hypothetical protein
MSELHLSEASYIRRKEPLASRSYNFMPTVLWSLLLAFGVLILLNMGPRHAPLPSALVAYRCDPPPILPATGSGRANAAIAGALIYTCRAGDAVIHARGRLPFGSNAAGWSACVRSGGVISLWRVPLPSPYGARIFQSACGDEVYLTYRAAAEGYAAGHATAFLVGVGAIGLAASALALKLLGRRITAVGSASRARVPPKDYGRRR